MKKSYILGIVIIGIAITVIISTAGDASSYVTFKEALEMVEKDKNTKIHVVGQLKKDNEGNVVGVYPSEDMLSFSFMLVDNNGQEQIVTYHEPMPNDFLRSEQVVVIGGYKNDEKFVADKILMKCPSKYQETEVK